METIVTLRFKTIYITIDYLQCPIQWIVAICNSYRPSESVHTKCTKVYEIWFRCQKITGILGVCNRSIDSETLLAFCVQWFGSVVVCKETYAMEHEECDAPDSFRRQWFSLFSAEVSEQLCQVVVRVSGINLHCDVQDVNRLLDLLLHLNEINGCYVYYYVMMRMKRYTIWKMFHRYTGLSLATIPLSPHGPEIPGSMPSLSNHKWPMR